MSGKRKYFPNNWLRYKNSPDSMFMTHTYEEIMDFKIRGWELPSNIYCLIREKNLTTYKIKEHVYQLGHAAEKKLDELWHKNDVEFTVCTPEDIQFVTTHTADEKEDHPFEENL